LRYTELIVPTDATYQFVFPTVVGPRYNGSIASGSGKAEQWISTPHLHSGELSNAKFVMHVSVVAPTAVRDIASPTHAVTLNAVSKQETAVQLVDTGRNDNNRDFILNYSLAGERIESGLLLSKGDKENFFLAMVEPPKQVAAAAIVPREYIFVVDVSGSMYGFPLDTTKVLMKKLLGSLRASDTFNVMMFSGGNTVIAPQSIPATSANIAMATRMLGQQNGGGATELLPALRKALSTPADSDRARTFIVITDGYVTVEREAFSLISSNLANANLFAFGIGSSVNRQLIEGMARAGQGEPFIALNADSALVEAERFRKMIDAPVLTHIQAHFEGLDAYDIQPASVPDVFAQRPIIIFGKWRGQPKGKLVLEGQAADGKKHVEVVVNAEQSITKNDALRYLWARHRIASLTDQETLEGGDSYRQSILDLGLQYNLLTQYTSFIAVDHVVRNTAPADAANVNQPLPLPEGVSNLAVGAEVPSTPEPSTYAMLALAALGMWWMRKRSNSSQLN
jgi:Ca-activated chloride channel homolog